MQLPADIDRLAQLGWRLYPSTRARKGMFRGYIDAATSDRSTLSQWAEQYPDAIGRSFPKGPLFGPWIWIRHRWITQLTGIGLRELCARHGCLPPSPQGRTGGGGDLLVFRDVGHPIRTKTVPSARN